MEKERLKMNKIIEKAEKFVKNYFLKFSNPGHDWLHTSRVRNLALSIGKDFKINQSVLEIAALFHDVGYIENKKFHAPASARTAKDFLKDFNLEKGFIDIITKSIIEHENIDEPTYLEGKILQDADKLDGMGAIGIIRITGGSSFKHSPEYDKENPFGRGYKGNLEKWIKKNVKEAPKKKLRTDEYLIENIIGREMQWINMMWTEKGSKMAKNRFDFMKSFLIEFENNLKEASIL